MHIFLILFIIASRLIVISSFLIQSQPLKKIFYQSKEDLKWVPSIQSLEDRRQLRGQKNNDELINSISFHHIEFFCGDAKSTSYMFSLGLGMVMTGITCQSTGNDKCVSYGLESGDVRFLFTAPYSESATEGKSNESETFKEDEYDSRYPLPSFSVSSAHDFFRKHGFGAKAVGIEVVNCRKAFEASVQRGAKPILEPVIVPACPGYLRDFDAKDKDEISYGCEMAEVELYGDVVLRYVSFPRKTKSSLPFLPHLSPYSSNQKVTYGINRVDHAVGNIPDLMKYHNYISKFTGFHEFAEFTAEDVGTVESGLNSVVLASDSEYVLLPLNEPTTGRRKSQIQTFLEQNEGPGLQHLALKTDDIFETIAKIQEFSFFELMKRPSEEYYRDLPQKLNNQLTPEQYMKCQKFGILADADDEGMLLQIFTKPIGDRPTFFIEIIQRIGCVYRSPDSDKELQRPGCGGFGQGNFKELFKAIEDYEKTLKI